jgi:hypothetical protein
MVRVLTKIFHKLFPQRRKRKSPAVLPAQAKGQPPPVSEEEVRKRLEGLGYIE